MRQKLRMSVLAGALGLAMPALAQSPAELAFWKSVQNSNNPAELQAYLDAYPRGRFAALARVRIAALRKAAPAPQPSAPPVAKEETPGGPASAPELRETQSATPQEPPNAAANPARAEMSRASKSLSAAVRAGNLEGVKEAIAQKADVNALDDTGMPPMGLAALLGRQEIIAFLATKGADVNRNDRFGFTPLMNAAIRGQADATRLLIALHADPALKGGNGNDPLGAARPSGPGDRRYEGKVAVGKMLEAAIATRSPSGGARQR
jgi:hypothetical protein